MSPGAQLKRNWRKIAAVATLSTAAALGVFLILHLAGTEHFDNLEIRGTRRFKARVIQALTLLRSKTPQAYEIVTNNVGAITQSKRSGMAAYRKPPTFELNDQTAFYSVTWCAGAIAHDSLHSRFYFNYLKLHPGEKVVINDAWMGEVAEKLCCEHQLRVLRQINASPKEIAQCVAAETNGYWNIDYKKRNW